jgi:hypothetical protein
MKLSRKLPIPTFLLFCSLMFGRPVAAADQCLTCHESLGDKASSLFKRDVHHLKGIPCSGCHGGDPNSSDMETAMAKGAGFIGVPHGDAISAACAQCHARVEKMRTFGSSLPTNQLSLLEGSVHGKLSIGGKERIVQCITCHGAHGIVPVNDPLSPVHPSRVVKTCTSCHSNAAYIRSYNPALAVDQLDKYRTSVHGIRNAAGDPKVAECASCHGSHGILPVKDVKSPVYPTNIPETCAACHSNAAYMKEYGIPTDQFEKFSKSVHGVALLVKKDPGAPACNSCHGNHGATPPGVESISKVCGVCHALNADLFSVSPHKPAFDAQNLPECETCHGNHAVAPATTAMLGTASDAVCSKCHTERENPKAYGSARVMRELIDTLEASETAARGLVDDAEQKGMEISDAKFKLRDIRQARLEARTTLHAFREEKLREVVNRGLGISKAVAGDARHQIDEYYYRRIGLGIATLIITVLAVSLYVYIRRLERRQAGRGTAHINSHTNS